MKPIVITISGKARHGKTTFAKYLSQELNCKVIAFADALREKAYQHGWNGEKDNNGRVLLQFIGTEWGRECIDPDIWVKKTEENFCGDYIIIDDCRFINEATYYREHGYTQINVRIIRYTYKQPLLTKILNLFRKNKIPPKTVEYDNGLTPAQKRHKSETGLDFFQHDYYFTACNMEELQMYAEGFAHELEGKYENI